MIDGEVIAHCQQPLLLEEQGLEPVFYLPLRDINLGYLRPSEKPSYCPYKGHANYWSLQVKNRLVKDAAWEYKQPYKCINVIPDHIAFYLAKMDEVHANTNHVDLSTKNDLATLNHNTTKEK